MEVFVKNQSFEFENQVNGFQVAKSFDQEHHKNIIAYKKNNQLFDMSTLLNDGDEIEFIYKSDDDKVAFEILNHSTSHLMAEAILKLFPDAKLGFGPAIDEGFYYDVDFNDYQLKEEDLAKIESLMKKLAKENNNFKRQVVSKQEALEIFKNDPYKIELINGINDEITIYTQGSFTDLCHGIHLPNTSYIKNFKLLSIAGAYWRGDIKNKQLTRIYGISFYEQENLNKYLLMLEERKKRDHRKLGKELGLFMLSEYYSQIFALLSSLGPSFIKSYGLYPVSISYKIHAVFILKNSGRRGLGAAKSCSKIAL